MMKKILQAGIVLSLLFIVFLKPVSAACDPLQYNASKEETKVSLWPIPAPTCDKGYCTASSICTPQVGQTCVTKCWPPGSTTASYSCPTGQWWNSTKKCCYLAVDYNQQACVGTTRSCPDVTYVYNKDKDLCEKIAASSWSLKAKCNNDTDGIQTAIGCVPISAGNLTKDDGFLSFLLKFAFGISGAVILFMIIFTGYTLLTSGGNPEKLQLAKENIVSIFSGLILIAFSLILLQTIGADILQLPTFR